MRSKKAMYNIVTTLILQFVVLISGFIVPKLIIGKFGSNVWVTFFDNTVFSLY